MRSAAAVTRELDDLQLAAEELIEGIRGQIQLGKYSCGILYYDFDAEGAALSGILHEALGIDIMGCSTLALLEGREGYCDMAASLMVLTSDDCPMSTIATEPLYAHNDASSAAAAFEAAKEALGTEPKLAVLLAPVNGQAVADRIIEAISQASGQIPIVGGVAASDDIAEENLAYNGEHLTDSAVMLLIGGEVRPLCNLVNVSSTFTDKACRITKSEGATIYEVDGDSTLLSFIEGFGFDITGASEDDRRVFFRQYPLLLSDTKLSAVGDLPYVRILASVDVEKGSASAYAFTPEGSEAKLAMLERTEIGKSAAKGMQAMLEQISAASTDDYQYSTVLCFTCAARHYIMTPIFSAEGDEIKAILPDGLTLSAFYSHGEIVPTSVLDGKAANRVHNGSVAFCAI